MIRDEFTTQIKAVWPDATVEIEDSPGAIAIWIDSEDHDLTIEVSGNEPKALAAALAAAKGVKEA